MVLLDQDQLQAFKQRGLWRETVFYLTAISWVSRGGTRQKSWKRNTSLTLLLKAYAWEEICVGMGGKARSPKFRLVTSL